MSGINFVLCPSHRKSTCITHLQFCKLHTLTVAERCSLALHQKVSFIARDIFLMTLFISVKIQVYVSLPLAEIIHAILYVSNSVSFDVHRAVHRNIIPIVKPNR